MSDDSRIDLSRVLARLAEGDDAAFETLLPLVYEELRGLADLYMSRERSGHTLQPTALIHEAYLRLREHPSVDWQSKAHFLGVAAGAMRQVLVDHARARQAKKRGGDRERVPLDDVADTSGLSTVDGVDLIALDRALDRLAVDGRRQARVVELIYFGGLTAGEAAEVLGVTRRTIERDWRAARAWLLRELSSDVPAGLAAARGRPAK